MQIHVPAEHSAVIDTKHCRTIRPAAAATEQQRVVGNNVGGGELQAVKTDPQTRPVASLQEQPAGKAVSHVTDQKVLESRCGASAAGGHKQPGSGPCEKDPVAQVRLWDHSSTVAYGV